MNSNLTASEQWKLHGALSEQTVNDLLDLQHACENLEVGWAVGALEEAKSCLPAEDVLTAPMRDLANIIKRSRGNGKELLQGVFNDLHAAMERLRSDADHGKEQISEVQKALGEYPIAKK